MKIGDIFYKHFDGQISKRCCYDAAAEIVADRTEKVLEWKCKDCSYTCLKAEKDKDICRAEIKQILEG